MPVAFESPSVLVPAFDADHPRHAEAREKLATTSLLHVSGGILAEVTTVLRRRANDVGLDGSKVARGAKLRRRDRDRPREAQTRAVKRERSKRA